MNLPLVSIVIPCYNHERFVQDSIQGVIDQTYQNIELIIIDDGSSDGSVAKIEKMIEKCQERFTRFEFRHRLNKGLSATLNEALEWCQGKYYTAIASDDIMLPEKTKIQVDYLELNKDVAAVLGAVNWINDNNIITNSRKLSYREYNFEKIFLSQHSLYACTQLTRTSDIKNLGGYKIGCAIEDWYMWLKLAKLGKIVTLNNIFVDYRLHENNTIKKGEIIYEAMIEVANDYKSHPLYNQSINQINWVRVAAIIKQDKIKGLLLFKDLFKEDYKSIFHKNFYRCLRNFVIF